MSLPRRFLLACAVWMVTISLLHAWLNTRAFDRTARPGEEANTFRVGFIPVT
jgi:hypothetical protein